MSIVTWKNGLSYWKVKKKNRALFLTIFKIYRKVLTTKLEDKF